MRFDAFITTGDFLSLGAGLGIGAALLWRTGGGRFARAGIIMLYLLLETVALLVSTFFVLGVVFDMWL